MTTSLHTDISGWATRLNTEDVARYTGSGVWRNVTLAETARRQAGQDAQRIAVIEGGIQQKLPTKELFVKNLWGE